MQVSSLRIAGFLSIGILLASSGTASAGRSGNKLHLPVQAVTEVVKAYTHPKAYYDREFASAARTARESLALRKAPVRPKFSVAHAGMAMFGGFAAFFVWNAADAAVRGQVPVSAANLVPAVLTVPWIQGARRKATSDKLLESAKRSNVSLDVHTLDVLRSYQ